MKSPIKFKFAFLLYICLDQKVEAGFLSSPKEVQYPAVMLQSDVEAELKAEALLQRALDDSNPLLWS